MAIKLENKQNVNAPTAEFPYGDVRDKTSVISGTKYNRATMSDLFQFFEKIMDEAGVIHNGIEDNEYDGWQLYEAFRKLTKPYKMANLKITQTSSNAPVVTEVGPNDIGAITGVYNSTGSFSLQSTGNFTVGKTFVLHSQSTELDSIVKAVESTVNIVSLASYTATTGASANGKITNMSVQILVFD
jgi:hypothetical protein